MPGQPGSLPVPMRRALDAIDHAIVDVLARDGRTTIFDVSGSVERSETTVRERLAAMVADGVVQGYSARVDWDLVGLPIHAVIDGDCSREHEPQVSACLAAQGKIVQAVLTTGSPNLLAIARMHDLHELRDVCGHLAAAGLSNIMVRVTLQRLLAERPPTP